jgi:hypothetical protein
MRYLGLIDFWKNEQQETGEEERRKEVKGKKEEFGETAENILQSSISLYVRVLHSKCLRSACMETRSRWKGEATVS